MDNLKVGDILRSKLSHRKVKILDIDLDDDCVIVKERYSKRNSYAIGRAQLAYWEVMHGRNAEELCRPVW